nr:MAG TPA: hypothetical protein [Caudoviricetes sp.]
MLLKLHIGVSSRHKVGMFGISRYYAEGQADTCLFVI